MEAGRDSVCVSMRERREKWSEAGRRLCFGEGKGVSISTVIAKWSEMVMSKPES